MPFHPPNFGIIIGNADRNIRKCGIVVISICTANTMANCTGVVAFGDSVVNGCHGNCLGSIPVSRCESDGSFINGNLITTV